MSLTRGCANCIWNFATDMNLTLLRILFEIF